MKEGGEKKKKWLHIFYEIKQKVWMNQKHNMNLHYFSGMIMKWVNMHYLIIMTYINCLSYVLIEVRDSEDMMDYQHDEEMDDQVDQ